MVVVLAPIVVQYGVAAVAVVSLIAGAMVIAAGLARIGRVVTYIPWPVIEGFTLGIAVIIAAQQVPAALGVPVEVEPHALLGAVDAVLAAQWPVVGWTLGIVAIVAVLMLLLPRIHRLMPASLIAIVIVTVLATLLDAPVAVDRRAARAAARARAAVARRHRPARTHRPGGGRREHRQRRRGGGFGDHPDATIGDRVLGEASAARAP